MVDIKKLLKKKTWTGKDIGILNIATMTIYLKEKAFEHKKDAKPLLTWEQLDAMAKALTSSKDIDDYNGYVEIHKWIEETYLHSVTHEQQLQFRLERFLHYASVALVAEQFRTHLFALPSIMTEKQYEDTIAEGRKRAMFNEEGEPRTEPIRDLVFRGLTYYIKLLESSPKSANPLKKIWPKYKEQPVKDGWILDSYYERTRYGYYLLEDGTRSDEASQVEWIRAICANKELADILVRLVEGEGDKLITRDELESAYHRGCKDEDGYIYKKGDMREATFTLYTGRPKELNKGAFLREDLYEFYCDAAWDKVHSKAEHVNDVEHFYSEFKEVADIILEDLGKKGLRFGGKPAKDIPVKKWEEYELTYEELYEKDVYDIKAEIESYHASYAGNQRALFNGVAILKDKDSFLWERNCNEQGYYDEPQPIDGLLERIGLESFYTENKQYAKNIEDLQESYELYISSYRALKGSAIALDLVEKQFGLYDLSPLKPDVESHERKAESFNHILELLRENVDLLGLYDKKTQAQKLQVLEDVFLPIDLTAGQVPEENIRKAEELLRDGYRAFTWEGRQELHELLLWSGGPWSIAK